MKDELFHSDIYLGKDFSDGIQHFKYIKREKKNGKWVYYYQDDEYEKDRMLGRMGDLHRADLAKDKRDKLYADRVANEQYIRYYDANKKDKKFYENQYKQSLRNQTAMTKKINKKQEQYWEDAMRAVGSSPVKRYYNTYEKGEQAVINAHNNNKLIKAREKVAKGLVKSLNAVENAKVKGKSIFKKIFKK
jgi:hypothetical protein